MRIVRYLKHSIPAVLIIAALLVVQAACDLALPNYTSRIVDVGIQQSGVEHASTDELSVRTYDAVAMMLSEEDEAAFSAAYAETPEGTYALTDEGRAARESLDEMVSVPLVLVHGSSGASESKFDLDDVLSAYEAGFLSKDQVRAMVEAVSSQLQEAGDALIGQQAIVAARAEYEQLGYDMAEMQMNSLVRFGLSMLGIAAVGMAAAACVGFVAARTGAKIGRRLRKQLFDKVVSFSDAEIGRFSAASLITRGTNDIQLIQNVSVMLLRMVIYAPILAVGGIVMVAQTNIAMSWVIVLAVIAIMVLVFALMRVALPKFRIMQKLIDRVNLVSREVLTGMPVIRAFNRERHEEERFDAASTDLMRTQLFTNRVMTFMSPVMMLVMNGTSVLIVWVGAGYIDTGVIQTGDLIAFITYSMVIVMSFFMISMVSIMLPRADVAAARIDEVVATEPSIHDPAEPRDGELARTPGATVEFRDVSFGYSDSEEHAISHVSFTAEAGKTTAIIGSTGSGKSTLLKLLMRFYDATDGSVLVDGIDVRDLSQHALRRQFGYVPQQAFLFSGTIASNVAYSDESMDAQRISSALSIAQAADFVAEKEEGVDSPVSQGGTNVSGGQRQRLAIARAIASNARAYLFDDSFSALDYRTDAALRDALATELAGRTAIIVAQRISTISHADLIVVLDEGRIVGQGTHAQLLASCKEYREIALSQLSEAELAKGGDAA